MIGVAAVPSKATAAPACVPREISLMRCSVAGIGYYDYPRVAGALASGARLVLRRQPANPHDHRAIEVFTEAGAKLGYVPRADNAAVSSLMDAGYVLLARIADHGRDSSRWWRVSMEVSMVERMGVRSAVG